MNGEVVTELIRLLRQAILIRTENAQVDSNAPRAYHQWNEAEDCENSKERESLVSDFFDAFPTHTIGRLRNSTLPTAMNEDPKIMSTESQIIVLKWPQALSATIAATMVKA